MEILLRGQLASGICVLIDDCLFEFFNQWAWQLGQSGYAERHDSQQGKMYMHRVILPCDTGLYIDHIDRNRLNNQRRNLRIVDASTNGRNRGLQKNNTSGAKNVYWSETRQQWYVQIQHPSFGLRSSGRPKVKHLGYYRDFIIAKEVRDDF